MHERKCRLNGKFRAKLIEILVAGTTARAIAEITGVNQNTVRGFLKRLRKFIATKLPDYAFSGEAEVDERYYREARKGKRGRGAAGKITVFNLFKRDGNVCTAIISDAKTKTLLLRTLKCPIQIHPESIPILTAGDCIHHV